MPFDSALRARRRELRLTQAQLADAAGVSRQLVVAAETGVNKPSVDAALRLARALGCEADDLFAAASQSGSRPPVPRSEPERAARGALVVAGCDPALRIAETMLLGAGEARMLALDATTASALRSLRSHGVHAAVVHGPAGGLPHAPGGVVRIQLARWRVGLGISPAVPVSSLEQCLEQRVQIVQREPGASSQQALERAAQALGRTPRGGTIVASHLDAARAARALGCAAITTEGAALALELRFVALEPHTVELWIDPDAQQHPGVQALGDMLTGRAFARRVRRLGGYDLTGCGSVLPS